MKTFLASYRNEWDKLMSRKKYTVFLVIGVSICLLWVAMGQLITNFASTQGGVMINLTPTPMGMLPMFLQLIVPFLIFMGVTDLLTVEGAENTMKAMIFRPVERWKQYFSKIFAVVTYAVLYLACIFVVCAVLNQIFGRALRMDELLASLASYMLTIVPLAILASFAALVALFGKSGTLTMFILLFSYLLLNVAPVFFPVLGEMLFTSYLSWHRLWIGVLPDTLKLVHMLLIVLGYGVAFFTAGSLIYEKKEY
ncbi:MAG: ABC transporter permease [Oscillospiraceae bacterium]|nr:ABC transporter permease [Oscillospiraceae bacterium]